MTEVLESTDTKCHHCGEVCQEEEVRLDQKTFCCYGCRAVYELLVANDLEAYYANKDLNAKPIQESVRTERKFRFLEEERVLSQLLKFRDETRSVIKFYVGGIHCSSCIYLLEHLPKLQSGIYQSRVNFVRKEVTITYDHNRMSLKELVILMTNLGYEPTINLSNLDSARKRLKRDSIGLKIAVAGFCFGNSMLMSLPEYLDTGFQLDNEFKLLFSRINLLLALPVLLYSAVDYFKSAWRGLTHRHLNIDVPIVLGVVTLFARSVFEIVFEVGPGYVDSLAGLVFFLLIGKWYQGKTYQALSFDRDYSSYFPISVTRLKENEEQEVLLKELSIGDRIIIHNQELIPADSIVLKGRPSLDYSFVTGESELISKEIGEKVFAGGRQVGGPLELELEKDVLSSDLTQLWKSDSFKNDDSGYRLLIDRVSQYFTLVVLAIALSTFFFWLWKDPSKMWSATSAVLIIACPCALALTLPFAYGHAMRVLGRIGLFLKSASIVESINTITDIVLDKTGTLTKADPLKMTFIGKELSTLQLRLIKTAASNSGHPLSRMIAQSIADQFQKLPISTFWEKEGLGHQSEIEGHVVKIGSAALMDENVDQPSNESHVFIEIDGDCLGYYSIQSNYRLGIFTVLKKLGHKWKLHLLSGDNNAESDRLQPYFDRLAFNQKPKDKLEYVNHVSGQIMMVGDGLNDAGALKAARVGLSVCEDIHQFSPACDGMIQADAIKLLPKILVFSQKVIKVVIAALFLSFAYNIVGLSFAVTGQLTPVVSAILMPLSSLTVVGFITILVNLYGRSLSLSS